MHLALASIFVCAQVSHTEQTVDKGWKTNVSLQIIMACLIDHFALVGVAKRTYTVWRILASLGLVGCVVVIAKF